MSNSPLDLVYTAPHPDELEILAGGAIARPVNQGYRVGMIHMTDGEPTPRGRLDARLAKMREAAGIPGEHRCEMLCLPNRGWTG